MELIQRKIQQSKRIKLGNELLEVSQVVNEKIATWDHVETNEKNLNAFIQFSDKVEVDEEV